MSGVCANASVNAARPPSASPACSFSSPIAAYALTSNSVANGFKAERGYAVMKALSFSTRSAGGSGKIASSSAFSGVSRETTTVFVAGSFVELSFVKTSLTERCFAGEGFAAGSLVGVSGVVVSFEIAATASVSFGFTLAGSEACCGRTSVVVVAAVVAVCACSIPSMLKPRFSAICVMKVCAAVIKASL